MASFFPGLNPSTFLVPKKAKRKPRRRRKAADKKISFEGKSLYYSLHEKEAEIIKIGSSQGQAKEVVHTIALTLQDVEFKREVGIEATELVKGGSLGQGTAIHGHYDADLVLYSRSLHYMAAVKEGYAEVLEKTHVYLERKLAPNFTLESIGTVALKFNYTLSGERELDVDLLLSPYWENQHDFFSAMRSIHPPIKRLMFSASTSKWQKDYIRSRNSHVRELICRAKAWRNKLWEKSTDGRPKSYLLSLLVITAYNKTPGASMSRRLRIYAHEVTVTLRQLVKDIECDKITDLFIEGAGEDLRRIYADLLPDRPRIVDPTNPCNNVYLSGVGPIKDGPRHIKRWSIFANNIDHFNLALSIPAIQKKRV